MSGRQAAVPAHCLVPSSFVLAARSLEPREVTSRCNDEAAFELPTVDRFLQPAAAALLDGTFAPVRATAIWSSSARETSEPREGGSNPRQDDSPCCIAAGYSPGGRSLTKALTHCREGRRCGVLGRMGQGGDGTR